MDTQSTAKEIVVLIKYSFKLENILGYIKEQLEFDCEHEMKKIGDIAHNGPFVQAVYKGFLMTKVQ